MSDDRRTSPRRVVNAGSTLFFDVCLQRDLGPGGAWPLLSDDEVREAQALFRGAAAFAVRQAGVVCAHVSAADPPHCRSGSAGSARLDGCVPALPLAVVSPAVDDGTTDRR